MNGDSPFFLTSQRSDWNCQRISPRYSFLIPNLPPFLRKSKCVTIYAGIGMMGLDEGEALVSAIGSPRAAINPVRENNILCRRWANTMCRSSRGKGGHPSGPWLWKSRSKRFKGRKLQIDLRIELKRDVHGSGR